MTAPDTSKPWPWFMLRYMMQDDEDSMDALLWSVGGSPPYGGISYEEAAAVYELIEDFRGSGEASEESYDEVRAHLRDNPEREQVLDLFRCYDRIVSHSDSYSADVVDEGLALAQSIGDPASVALFKLFHAGIMAREGQNAEAANFTLEALDSLLTAAEDNPASRKRVEQAAQNAVALTALAGDVPRARELFEMLSEVLPAQARDQIGRWLAAQS